jgi:pimeloyl-ACP methyl ester carboxylesterase
MANVGPGTVAVTPEWFERSIATPYDTCFVEVAACQIHYLRWGDAKKPGLLLLPGTGGHAHWFAHVAPLFADQFHVVSMDISGCGDSGRRDHYTRDLIVSEIMAVCADSGMLSAATPPILAGHSVGGQHVVRTAMAHGESLLGVIAIDGLRYAELAHDPAVKALEGPRPAPRTPPIYPDYQSAAARFRLVPPPAIEIQTDYVLEHIARHSVREVQGGWTWKFDAALASVSSLGLELKDALKDLSCYSAAIYGEYTHLADDTLLSRMMSFTNGEVPIFTIPGSSHYPMIDSPLAFVSGIKGVALAWIAVARRNQRPARPALDLGGGTRREC